MLTNSTEIVPKGELDDELLCDCLFYRQYQLPCSHIFQFDNIANVIKEENWQIWAYAFEESGFEHYESTNVEYIKSGVYDEPDGPSKHMLQVREVLDDIKNHFHAIEDNMKAMDFSADKRHQISKQFVANLRQMSGPIRKKGAEQALEELAKTSNVLGAMTLSEDDDDNKDQAK